MVDPYLLGTVIGKGIVLLWIGVRGLWKKFREAMQYKTNRSPFMGLAGHQVVFYDKELIKNLVVNE